MENDLRSPGHSVPERFVPGEASGQLVEAEHLGRYLWASGLASGRRVLDAGCGVGYGTDMLAVAGAVETVGIDVSDEAIQVAKSIGSTATFETGDVHDLPFVDGAFDLVVCFEVIEHVDRQDTALAELARVLSADGVLVVSSPNRDVYPPGNPHHLHEYLPNELRSAVARHLEHVELRRQHGWVASAILDDSEVTADGLARIDGIEVAKVLGAQPGTEPYTIAVASRRPLPPTSPHAVLTGLLEPRQWLDELATLRSEVAVAHHRLELIPALEKRRDRLEQDVRELEEIEQQLRGDNATLLATLDETRSTLSDIVNSPSWRITAPLRALGRRLRSRER